MSAAGSSAVPPDIDPLTRLAIRYGTDKWGIHFYTPVYHDLFRHLRDRPLRLLEIGVGGFASPRLGGASLRMWADYFPQGRIVGIDIAEKRLDLGPRIAILRGAQDDPAFLARVVAEHGPFDIVVDDGSHRPRHVVASFAALFPTLADRGLYVIEDVQTAFWPKFGGTPQGGDTFKLAFAILAALNHAEIRIARPDWQPPPMATRIRSFRAYHNLFVVEKGDNREPSSAAIDGGNPVFRHGLATIEQELAQSPTPDGFAHLARLLELGGEKPRAGAVVAEGLQKWPDHARLLALGCGLAQRMGDRESARHRLQRLAALFPDDADLARRLAAAAGED